MPGSTTGMMPRNFFWIVPSRLAVSERPGGQIMHHRPVRRKEEITWLRENGITRVVSLLESKHNLYAYRQGYLASANIPFGPSRSIDDVIASLYPNLEQWLRNGENILIHEDTLGDRALGIAAGFLLWTKVIQSKLQAVVLIEQISRRQLGAVAKAIVTASEQLPREIGALAQVDTPSSPDTSLDLDLITKDASEVQVSENLSNNEHLDVETVIQTSNEEDEPKNDNG